MPTTHEVYFPENLLEDGLGQLIVQRKKSWKKVEAGTQRIIAKLTRICGEDGVDYFLE